MSSRAQFAVSFAAVVPMLLSAVLSGCASETDEDAGMKVEAACLQTVCDLRQSEDASACSRCLSACSGASFDCDPSDSCAISCGSDPIECSDSDRNACAQSGFKASLPTTKSVELGDACKRMFDHAEQCGMQTNGRTPFDCDVWAKTERPELAATYDCVAALPCDDDGTTSCAVSPTDFGDRVCNAMDSLCGSAFCTDEQRDILNGDGGWLKESVMNAAIECTKQPTCGDAKGCFDAWVNAARL